jgi:hypothetical protein
MFADVCFRSYGVLGERITHSACHSEAERGGGICDNPDVISETCLHLQVSADADAKAVQAAVAKKIPPPRSASE